MKGSGPFFLGGASGLTPVKSKSSSSSLLNSPLKGHVIHEEDGEMKDKSGEEEEEDTRSLFACEGNSGREEGTEERRFANHHTTC